MHFCSMNSFTSMALIRALTPSLEFHLHIPYAAVKISAHLWLSTSLHPTNFCVAWIIPLAKGSGGLQFMRTQSQTRLSTHIYIHTMEYSTIIKYDNIHPLGKDVYLLLLRIKGTKIQNNL